MERGRSDEALSGRPQAAPARQFLRSKSAELQSAAARQQPIPSQPEEEPSATPVLPKPPEGEVVFESQPSKSRADFPLPASESSTKSAATSELEAKLRLRMLKCEGRDTLYKPRSTRCQDHSPRAKVPSRLKQRALTSSTEPKERAKNHELLVTASYQRCTKARACSAHSASRHKKKDLGQAQSQEADRARSWSRGAAVRKDAADPGGAPPAKAEAEQRTENAPEEPVPNCKTFALDDPTKDCEAVGESEVGQVAAAPAEPTAQPQPAGGRRRGAGGHAAEEEFSVDELLLDLVNHLPAHLAKKVGLMLRALHDLKQGGRISVEAGRPGKAQQRTPREQKELQGETEDLAAETARLQKQVAELQTEDLQARKNWRATTTELEALEQSIASQRQQQSGAEEALAASSKQLERAADLPQAHKAELSEARRLEEYCCLRLRSSELQRAHLRRGLEQRQSSQEEARAALEQSTARQAAAAALGIRMLQERRVKIASEEESARSEFEQCKSEVTDRTQRFKLRLETEISECRMKSEEMAETRAVDLSNLHLECLQQEANSRCLALRTEYLRGKTEALELRRRADSAKLAKQQCEERLGDVRSELQQGMSERDKLMDKLSEEQRNVKDRTAEWESLASQEDYLLQAKEALAVKIKMSTDAAVRNRTMTAQLHTVAERARREVQNAKASIPSRVQLHEANSANAARAAKRLQEHERQGEELRKEVEALREKVNVAARKVRCEELMTLDDHGKVQDSIADALELPGPGAICLAANSAQQRGNSQLPLVPTCNAWKRARCLTAPSDAAAAVSQPSQPSQASSAMRPLQQPSSEQERLQEQLLQRSARMCWDVQVMREDLEARQALDNVLRQSKYRFEPSTREGAHASPEQPNLKDAARETALPATWARLI